MAVHKHESGGFRAYKKIHGIEHQIYSRDESEAHSQQAKLEEMAQRAIEIAPQKIFHKNGKFYGFSIGKVIRKNREPCIYARMQLQKKGEKFRKEFRHQTIELTWAWIRREWKDFYELSVDERIALQDEISIAKSLYEVEIKRAVIELKNLKLKKTSLITL